MPSAEMYQGEQGSPIPLGAIMKSIEEQGRKEGPKGFLTDQKILQWFYATFRGVDTYPIATDTFLKASKEQYNSSWLMRELIQNFVDHNPEDHGTLNGVTIECVPSGTTLRYTLKGNWVFKEPTGVISPHSEKPEGEESAGGNGVGLKQAAIRLIRDFGAKRFEIQGEGWTAQYRKVDAKEVNAQLKEELAKSGQEPMKEVEEDWLLADVVETTNAGQCAYILEIENTNEELIGQLQHLMELGVSKENPYLKDPDFENEKGAIKWLPFSTERQYGRLFLNGQVMNYKENGKTPQNFWQGPEFLTLRINNMKYKMNIDRPPVDSYDLSKYTDALILSMNKKELIEQLQKSESLWSNIVAEAWGADRPGCSVLIEKIVHQLGKSWEEKTFMKPEEFAENFPGRNYLAKDSISDTQAAELVKQGYILCSEYFEKIGMPKASTKLSKIEVIKNEKPKDAYDVAEAIEKMAQDVGIKVAHETLTGNTPEEFAKELFQHLGSHCISCVESVERPGAFRLNLSAEWSEKMLNHDISNPKGEQQKLLHLVRGIIFYGLKNHIFTDDVYSSQGTAVTNYALRYDDFAEEDQLVARNRKYDDKESGVFLEFTVEAQHQEMVRAAATLFQDTREREISLVASPISAEEVVKTDAPTVASESVPAKNTVEGVIAIPAPVVETATIKDRVQEVVSAVSATTEVTSQDPTTPEQSPAKTEAVEVPVVVVQKATEEASLSAKDSETTPSDPKPVRRSILRKQQRRARGGGSDADIVDALEAIPVEHPEPEEIDVDRRVVRRQKNMASDTVKRLQQLSDQIPALEDAIAAIDAAVPSHKDVPIDEHDPVKQYLRWRNSDDFYGQAGDEGGYLTGKNLLNILVESQTADIAAVESESEDETPEEHALRVLNARLKAIIDEDTPEDGIIDFEIDINPEKRELAQLALMRLYAQIVTGAAIPNDLFIYKGAGALGVNIGQKAIGLHEELLNVGFFEAFNVMTHEVAHNQFMDHGLKFMTLLQALFTRSVQRQNEIIQKLDMRDELSTEDHILMEIQNRWKELQQQ